MKQATVPPIVSIAANGSAEEQERMPLLSSDASLAKVNVVGVANGRNKT